MFKLRNPTLNFSKIQIRYYLDNHMQFRGETATDALKELLVARAAPLQAGALFVDVGANVGQSVSFFRRLAQHERVPMLLVEPNPANVEQLRARFGGEPLVRIAAVAAAAERGEHALYLHAATDVAGNQVGSLASKVLYPRGGDHGESVPVEGVPLDELLADAGHARDPIALLKVDTEGFDQLVLYGARAALRRTDLVLWECHALQRAELGGPNTSLFESVHFFATLGFATFVVGPRLMRLDDGRYHPGFDRFLQWQNCFSFRKNSTLHSVRDLLNENMLDECQ